MIVSDLKKFDTIQPPFWRSNGVKFTPFNRGQILLEVTLKIFWHHLTSILEVKWCQFYTIQPWLNSIESDKKSYGIQCSVKTWECLADKLYKFCRNDFQKGVPKKGVAKKEQCNYRLRQPKCKYILCSTNSRFEKFRKTQK